VQGTHILVVVRGTCFSAKYRPKFRKAPPPPARGFPLMEYIPHEHDANALEGSQFSDMNKGCLGGHAGLVRRSLMAVGGRTSSRILFHMSSVGTVDHMRWGMSRRTVEGVRTGVQRHTHTSENSPLKQGSSL
jgi:hypothetical protein